MKGSNEICGKFDNLEGNFDFWHKEIGIVDKRLGTDPVTLSIKLSAIVMQP